MTKRIDDIEVLRAVAVIFVVCWHLWDNLLGPPGQLVTLMKTWTNTGIGVDLFFAISGFVIARDLVPRIEAGAAQGQPYRVFVVFWIRRAWRLLPSAWLWLAIIMLAAIFFNQSQKWGSVEANWGGVISALLHVANLRFAESFMQSPFGAAFPYWSLSLEEQFYILFPFIVLFLRYRLALFLLFLILLQLLIDRTMMGIVLRTDALAYGVLIAIWSKTASYQQFEPTFLGRSRLLRWAVVSILIVGLGAVMGSAVGIPYHWSIVALLSGVLVFIASWGKGYIMGPGILKSVMVWLGARSYAIYLIHIPAIYTSHELFVRLRDVLPRIQQYPNTFIILVSLGLLLCLSQLNYRLLEMPLRARGVQFANAYMNKSEKL